MSLSAQRQSLLTFKQMLRFLRVSIGILWELELEDCHSRTSSLIRSCSMLTHKSYWIETLVTGSRSNRLTLKPCLNLEGIRWLLSDNLSLSSRTKSLLRTTGYLWKLYFGKWLRLIKELVPNKWYFSTFLNDYLSNFIL